MRLVRHPANPLLSPIPDSPWESVNVFNPSVIHHRGRFHMHYRAQGPDSISRIGYAASRDGVHWDRRPEPVFEPAGPGERRGLEDPRVVEIDGVFYMTYTAYGDDPDAPPEATIAGGAVTPMIAGSDDLLTWRRIGSIARGENNKDHALFPSKVQGRYAALHRRTPDVWLAFSDDLATWPEPDKVRVFGPRQGNRWEAAKVGANGPPIETEDGWLVLYHGVDSKRVYRLGVCMVDRSDPSRVIRRPDGPIFWPEEAWEREGAVPNVVFSCANPVVGGTVYVFYGGADRVIGLATCGLGELVTYARDGA